MAATPPQHSDYGSPHHHHQHQRQEHQPQHLAAGSSTHTVETTATMMQRRDGQDVKLVGGYALGERLGHGSFATVFKGVRVAAATGDPSTSAADTAIPTTADHVAIKAIARNERLSKKVLENLEVEISILRNHRHPNVVGLYDVRKTPDHFYLLLEYCGGGDLQRLIRSRKIGRLSERLARRLMRDLTAGLRFLNDRRLIHRDIKPQNLLLTGPLPLDEVEDVGKTSEDEETRRRADFPSGRFALKIADFGFARHLQTASLAETLCGSPLYMAPEILQHQRYDAKADLWSAGTVLFEMISGRPPFHGENHIDLLRNIQRRAVRLPPGVKVSPECVALLRLLLNRNPLGRGSFDQFFAASDAFVALGCNGPPVGGAMETTPAAAAAAVATTGGGGGGPGRTVGGVGDSAVDPAGGSSASASASAGGPVGLGKIAETADDESSGDSAAAAAGENGGAASGSSADADAPHDATMAASPPTDAQMGSGVGGPSPRMGARIGGDEARGRAVTVSGGMTVPAAAGEAPASTTTSMVPSPLMNRHGGRQLNVTNVNLVAPDHHGGLGPTTAAHHHPVAPSYLPPHPGNLQVVQQGGPTTRAQNRQVPTSTSHFAPLVPSPPVGPVSWRGAGGGGPAPVLPPPLSLDGGNALGGKGPMVHHRQQQQQRDSVPASHLHPQHVQQQHQLMQQQQQQQHRYSSMSNSSSQGSSSGDEFVMVEHNHMQQSSYSSSSAAAVPATSLHQQHGAPVPPPPNQQQTQLRSFSASVRNAITSAATASPSLYASRGGGGASTGGSAVIVGGGGGASPRHGRGQRGSRGMLSTSPGTGGALVGAMMGPPQTRKQLRQQHQHQQGGELELLAKMLAAAEDVGRRAVNVAHLGDTRAYIAMRIVVVGGSGAVVGGSSSSVLSSMMPMEGIEEEYEGDDHDDHRAANANDDGEFGRRHLSKSTTSGMKTADDDHHDDEDDDDDDDDDEMPFALAPDDDPGVAAEGEGAGDDGTGVVRMTPHISPNPSSSEAPAAPVGGPSRGDSERSSSNDVMIHAHFREALSCYLKALPLMKGAVTAAQRVTEAIASMSPPTPHASPNVRLENGDDRPALAARCEVSLRWLAAQFNGVLERADAANAEIEKLSSQMLARKETEAKVVSVEELIYNHSLACGRDGAVKQLLGQYDAARVCYKSAGLLAETLLMEPRLGGEDRKILEGYVGGFAERIAEVERIRRHGGGHGDGARGAGGGSGSGVVSIVGGVVPRGGSFRIDSSTARAAATTTQPAPPFRNEAHNLTYQ